MQYAVLGLLIFVLVAGAFVIAWRSSKDRKAQRDLDKYLKQDFSDEEIGRLYERYIGHLYETEGYDVEYHGALNGLSDMGRDLIVSGQDEVFIVQTKCWSKKSQIHEKHIFQLFGSTTHFKRTSEKMGRPAKAVFYTTAKYSDVAKDVAKVLGVALKREGLDKSYPMIKCAVSPAGNRLYHLPFDENYDRVKVDLHRDEHFVKTVKEAVEMGFYRAS